MLQEPKVAGAWCLNLSKHKQPDAARELLESWGNQACVVVNEDISINCQGIRRWRKDMLPKERVIAALEHREPDRIPWGEHFIDFNVYRDILGRESLVHAKFAEIQAYWDGRRDEVVAHYKRDIVDLTLALEMDLVTTYVVPPKDYHPRPMERIDEKTYKDEAGRYYQVSSITHDLMAIPINTSFIQRNVGVEEVQSLIDQERENAKRLYQPEDSRYEVVHHTVEALGETHFVIMPCNGLEWPRFGETEEEGWMNLVLYPEVCAKIAELQGIQMIREVHLAAELGVDGILTVGDLGSSTNLAASPGIYREMIYPWQKAQAQEAHRLGLYVLRHCCGHVWPIIQELAEINDAYEGIQTSAGMDISELKRTVGKKLCLWGGIAHENIHGGTVEDIRDDAKHAFTNAAPGGGYIMGSSHSLAVGAKVENILEMKRCRDIWGVYPIVIR